MSQNLLVYRLPCVGDSASSFERVVKSLTPFCLKGSN